MRISHEPKRGCGYRKPGGLYLVTAPGVLRSCGKLPLPLTVCRACKHGIKPSRGTTWIDPDKALGLVDRPCNMDKASDCIDCPLANIRNTDSGPLVGEHLLVWIGESFYERPIDWIKETASMGASRRIPALPKDFKLGETWVYVAHRKAIEVECDCTRVYGGEDGTELVSRCSPDPECPECEGKGVAYQPGIFHLFKPTAVEYVVDEEKDSEEKLERLEKRGISLVKVIPIEDDEGQPELPLHQEAI